MRMMSRFFIFVLCLILVGVLSHLMFAFRARQSPMWRYAAYAMMRNAPDYDLRNCVDLESKDRKDFSKTRWKPLPCINTATSNYNPNYRAGNYARFIQNPEHRNFREIPKEEAVPGDMIIFFMKNGYARHAAVYTQDSLVGPLCATTAYPKGGYYRYFPYKIVLWFTRLFNSFHSVKYYRYFGNTSK